jgi:hypothetical protein
VSAWALQDGESVETESVQITNAAHKIEITWLSAARGGITLAVDDILSGSVTVDSSASTLEQVNLGPSDGITATAAGTLFFDEFESSSIAAPQRKYFMPIMMK